MGGYELSCPHCGLGFTAPEAESPKPSEQKREIALDPLRIYPALFLVLAVVWSVALLVFVATGKISSGLRSIIWTAFICGGLFGMYFRSHIELFQKPPRTTYGQFLFEISKPFWLPGIAFILLLFVGNSIGYVSLFNRPVVTEDGLIRGGAVSTATDRIVTYGHSTLLPGSGRGTVIRVWDAKTGEVLQTLGRESVSVTDAAISPDGRLAAAGFEDGSVDVWDVESGQLAGQFRAKQAVTHVAVSSKRNMVMATSRDFVSLKMDISIWNVRTGKMAYEQGGRDSSFQNSKMTHTDLVVSPDGALFGIGDIAGGLSLWDVQEREMSPELRERLARGRRVNPDMNRGYNFNPANVEKIYPSAPIQTGVRAIAIGPENRIVAVGSRNQLYVLRMTMSGSRPVYQEFATAKLELEPRRVAVSPDGKRVAVGFPGGRVDIWDSELKKRVASTERGLRSITFLGFTSDSKTLLFGDDTRFVRRVSVK